MITRLVSSISLSLSYIIDHQSWAAMTACTVSKTEQSFVNSYVKNEESSDDPTRYSMSHYLKIAGTENCVPD